MFCHVVGPGSIPEGRIYFLKVFFFFSQKDVIFSHGRIYVLKAFFFFSHKYAIFSLILHPRRGCSFWVSFFFFVSYFAGMARFIVSCLRVSDGRTLVCRIFWRMALVRVMGHSEVV